MTNANTTNAATTDAAATIADALRTHGWFCQPNFFGDQQVEALRADLLQQRAAFAPAAIGRADGRQRLTAIRTDATLWLRGDNPVQQTFLAELDVLRLELNRRLFLGLADYEAHYAHYAPGAFYRRHLDAFQQRDDDGSPRRVLSTVFYLNAQWRDDAGGELIVWNSDEHEMARIAPRAGTAVFFLSAEFPHEVLPAALDRYSIAGWFRTRGAAL